jgi:hypothetical protein
VVHLKTSGSTKSCCAWIELIKHWAFLCVWYDFFCLVWSHFGMKQVKAWLMCRSWACKFHRALLFGGWSRWNPDPLTCVQEVARWALVLARPQLSASEDRFPSRWASGLTISCCEVWLRCVLLCYEKTVMSYGNDIMSYEKTKSRSVWVVESWEHMCPVFFMNLIWIFSDISRGLRRGHHPLFF